MESLSFYKISFLSFLTAILIFGCTNEQPVSNAKPTYFEENHKYLQEMILCRCLYSIDSSLKINEASTGFFFNRSSYNPEIFQKIDTIVMQLKPHFEGEGNSKLGVAECIHLYESDTLKKEINKLDNYLAPLE